MNNGLHVVRIDASMRRSKADARTVARDAAIAACRDDEDCRCR